MHGATIKIAEGILASGRSRCSCGMLCRSEAAWLVGSWIWILLRTWMCVCCVLSRQLITRSESYRVYVI